MWLSKEINVAYPRKVESPPKRISEPKKNSPTRLPESFKDWINYTLDFVPGLDWSQSVCVGWGITP